VLKQRLSKTCGSSEIPEACGCKKCFGITNELRDAVNKFMLGGDVAMTELATTYGLPMGTWCISNIQDLSSLFDIDRNSLASNFNEDLSTWDTAKVSTMQWMFYGAASFDRDLSSWSTSNVENLNYMFWDASSFNKALATWDTAKVSTMNRMFLSCPVEHVVHILYI
jgi:surface protein